MRIGCPRGTGERCGFQKRYATDYAPALGYRTNDVANRDPRANDRPARDDRLCSGYKERLRSENLEF